jgi:hypothetical protein
MPISPELLALLRQARYDPSADRGYNHFTGGFLWSDEFPEGFWEVALRLDGWSDCELVAHRAAVILGGDVGRFASTWQEVEREAPNWPGSPAGAPGPESCGPVDRQA